MDDGPEGAQKTRTGAAGKGPVKAVPKAVAKAGPKDAQRTPAGPGARKRPARRQPARDTAAEKRQNRLILWGILALALVVYVNSLGNGFVDFDDPENVAGNYVVHEFSTANVVHWFTRPLQFMYTPLVYLSYAVDHQIGGLDPTVYHVTNLALHLINVVLVFLVVHALTGNAFRSHFVAAAFAIHPVNVDGVAWVSTRSNLLATLFFLATMLFYLKYVSSRRALLLVAASLFFLLATLSKSPAVVLPLTLFLIDYYRRRGLGWRLLIEKIPFLVIAAVMGVVGLMFRVDTVNPHDYGIVDRVAVVCTALLAYVAKLFLPVDLAFAYAYPTRDGGHLPWYFHLAPLGLLLIGALLWRIRRSRRAIVFGLGFFLVNIVLSQTVLLIDNYHANRYAYLPYVGLFLVLAVLVERAWHAARRAKVPHLRPAIAVVLAGFVAFFSVLTVARNAAWENTNTIMSDAIAKEPAVAFPHNSRGIWRYEQGDYEGALKDFHNTLAVDPEFTLSYYYIGNVKYVQRDYAGALADYDRTLEVFWDFAEAYLGRGKTKIELRDFGGALADLNTAIQYDPNLIEAYHFRGTAHNELGDSRAALADLDRAIELFPTYADAFYQRGVARSRLNDTPGACADWRTAGSLGSQPATLASSGCPA